MDGAVWSVGEWQVVHPARALAGLLPATPATEFERQQNGGWIDLTARPPHRRNLAYAPQHSSLFPHLTVEENIAFPYSVCASPPKQSTQVDEATGLFGLHALRGRYPAELSGGERQRVSLARAFATPQACLTLLDEPFSGLDRRLRDEVLPRMQEWLTAHKLPVLSVTHDVDEALLLGADVLRLDSGLITAQGPAAEVLGEERRRMLRVLSATQGKPV